ncbi:MAG: double zinc ribbon domain-containing protein [Rubrobacter sp.]
MSAVVVLQTDPFETISQALESPYLTLGLRLVLLFFAILWLSLVYWTFADAGRRGTMRWYWGVVAFLFPFLGTLIYVIVRPPEYLAETRERELELAYLERELTQKVDLCPNCREIVEKDYLICPECGRDLKKPCTNCSKPLNMKWETCPYCATEQRNNIAW